MSNFNQSKINISELKNVLKHIIETNKTLQEKGLVPLAVNVVGPAGLGKTSTLKQVGVECGFEKSNIVMLSLSSFEEVGDLIGIPISEYKMIKKEASGVKSIWVNEVALTSYEKAGWVTTSESRMSYSAPEWIQGKKGPGLLILDDYTRASQRFTQAIMELILNQEYVSWKLPENWTIVLSSNPDDGIYNVTDQDPAQRSRYLNVSLGWDSEIWAKWAEHNSVDSRCINFVLMNNEIIREETPEVNARSITLFFNAISSIKDFNGNLELIQLLGEGSLGTEVTATFVAFINNSFDTLISASEILDVTKPFEDVEKAIKDVIKSDIEYRADIAYVITTRLINYIDLKTKNDFYNQAVLDRIAYLITSNVLGGDLKFVLGRKLTNLNHLPALNNLFAIEGVIDNILD